MESRLHIFWIFLRLGCISFGGPTAHLAYFQSDIIDRRKWVTDARYADLIALCQFLPGPASSQVGMALGYLRGGKLGAIAAWAGFTLPSAILMTAFALGLAYFTVPDGALTGLKIAAFAVVAKALWQMGRRLCPDNLRRVMAVIVAGLVILGMAFTVPIFILQIGLILMAGVIGASVFKPAPQEPTDHKDGGGHFGWLVAFFVLLAVMPLLAQVFPQGALADVLYRTGAIVFGGGHVVLPILDAQVVPRGWVDADTFMAGYGAAQALPGPLFAFSAFIGGQAGGLLGAVIAVIAIYVPSFLLIFGVMPYWAKLSAIPKIRAALMGVNAAVVGILLAALYNPIWTSAMTEWPHIALGFAALIGVTFGKVPPWLIVLGCAVIGVFLF